MKYRRILLDIDAQRDFFAPGGSCYTPSATLAAVRLYDLFRWARVEHIPVISAVLRLREGQRRIMSRRPHCVEGTGGDRKLSQTVMPGRINLGMRNCTDLPENLLSDYRQVIFERRVTNLFSHARAERLFTQIEGATFIICGAGLAHGIAQAALGLRSRGFAVIVAKDATVDLSHPLAEMARRRMETKGVLFLPTAKIIAAPCPRRGRRRRQIGAILQGFG